ncbi:MAG: ice-binding family protein [Candidatus Uhrbacteria bacterium]|nr:ice-binding family protein [Candidatus Uhrbacteria bacterium]
MKKPNKNILITGVIVASFAVSFMGPRATFAASTPSLGLAASYGVLSGTYTNTSAAATVNGDVGFTIAPATPPLGAHPNYGSGVPYPVAHSTDAPNALTNLNSQGCTFTFAAGAIDLATDTTHGPIGVYTPGVYCTQTAAGAMSIGVGGITLSTPGTYIFRTSAPTNAFTTVDNSNVTLGPGVSACDVFWTPTGSTTLGATTTFAGTIIDNANFITVGANTTWNGRAISLGAGTVTTGSTVTITAPVCAAPPATLKVIKQVVNNNGGTSVASNFNLHVKLAGTDVAGSPAVGAVAPGTSYTLAAGTYVVSEDANSMYSQVFSGDCNTSGSVVLAPGDIKTCTITNDDLVQSSASFMGTINVVKRVINDNGRTKTIADFPLFINDIPVISGVTTRLPATPNQYNVRETLDPNYTRTFSGDCDVNGHIVLYSGENKFCIVTNDDIGEPVVVPPVPPLIDVVKVPNPLAMPFGPGDVTYTYTLRNIGTVPVTDITMVGDTCSPITLASGDTNANAKLEVNETWTYTCTTTLYETHTNTVVATGWANGLTATDIASATVVVGVPIVPPLIHVAKIPSPLTLLAGGGMVTYTKKVTNPGTVALSNVRLSDDKCSVVKYISGDTNSDSKLDQAETWTYTCQAKLTKTTTNTAIASGEANGLTARDFAIATVTVAAKVPPTPPAPKAPKLPNTGFGPDGLISWNLALAGIFIVAVTSLIAVRRKRRS